jgi:hypothetical protein
MGIEEEPGDLSRGAGSEQKESLAGRLKHVSQSSRETLFSFSSSLSRDNSLHRYAVQNHFSLLIYLKSAG